MDYIKLGVMLCAVCFFKLTLTLNLDDTIGYIWNPPTDYTCPEEWMKHGPYCYRHINRKLTWHQASLFCERYGSHLMRVEDTATVNFLQNNVTNGSTSQIIWTGLRMQSQTPFWHDGLGYMNMTVEVEHNPILNLGTFCYSINLSSSTLQYGRCDDSHTSVCYMEALPPDQLRCLDGLWYPNDWHYDDMIDCKDASDELFGRSPCSDHYRAAEGVLSTQSIPGRGGGIPKTYYSYTTCVWIIETPTDTLTQITFTEIKLEHLFDTVQIYIGARTEEKSVFVGEVYGGVRSNISLRTHGGLKIVLLPLTYQSYNNLMIIKFASDGTKVYKGFTANWRAVTPASCHMTYDVTETKTLLRPPLYGGLYSSWMSCEWILTTNSLAPVTVQILELDLAENLDDYLLILHGSQHNTLVNEVKLTSETDLDSIGPMIFIGGHVTIRFISGSHLQAKGFQLLYFSGCHMEMSFPSGVIQSPLFITDPSHHRQSLTCSWLFPGGQFPHLTLKVKTLNINHSVDSLQIITDKTEGPVIEEVKEDSEFESVSGRAKLLFFLSDGDISERNMKISYSSQGSMTPCKQNGCQNGGTCVDKEETAFHCICSPGFEGDHCEVNINECSTRPCKTTATCVDGVNMYFCHCPKTRFGARCNKVIQKKYDLYFYGGQSNPGRAISFHPVDISANHYLSIVASVRFANKGALGKFIGIHSTRSDHTPDQQILYFDEKGLHINKTSSGIASYPFQKSINDILWHKIGFTLKIHTGDLLIHVDGNTLKYSVDPKTLYLPSKIMAVLGGGFQGYLSQVYILDTEVTAPLFSDYTHTSCLAGPPGIIQLDWYAYHLGSGTMRVTPAHCDDNVIAGNKEVKFWSTVKGLGIAVNNDLRIPDISDPMVCRQKCLDEDGFQCRSLDVGLNKQQQSECLLARVRKDDVPQYWVRFPTYQYHELTLWTDKKIIPDNISCPDNQLVETEDTPVQMIWEEPVFNGAQQVLQNYHPGDDFSVGVYQVSYVGQWQDKQKMVCNFKLFVLPSTATTQVVSTALETSTPLYPMELEYDNTQTPITTTTKTSDFYGPSNVVDSTTHSPVTTHVDTIDKISSPTAQSQTDAFPSVTTSAESTKTATTTAIIPQRQSDNISITKVQSVVTDSVLKQSSSNTGFTADQQSNVEYSKEDKFVSSSTSTPAHMQLQDSSEATKDGHLDESYELTTKSYVHSTDVVYEDDTDETDDRYQYEFSTNSKEEPIQTANKATTDTSIENLAKEVQTDSPLTISTQSASQVTNLLGVTEYSLNTVTPKSDINDNLPTQTSPDNDLADIALDIDTTDVVDDISDKSIHRTSDSVFQTTSKQLSTTNIETGLLDAEISTELPNPDIPTSLPNVSDETVSITKPTYSSIKTSFDTDQTSTPDLLSDTDEIDNPHILELNTLSSTQFTTEYTNVSTKADTIQPITESHDLFVSTTTETTTLVSDANTEETTKTQTELPRRDHELAQDRVPSDRDNIEPNGYGFTLSSSTDLPLTKSFTTEATSVDRASWISNTASILGSVTHEKDLSAEREDGKNETVTTLSLKTTLNTDKTSQGTSSGEYGHKQQGTVSIDVTSTSGNTDKLESTSTNTLQSNLLTLSSVDMLAPSDSFAVENTGHKVGSTTPFTSQHQHISDDINTDSLTTTSTLSGYTAENKIGSTIARYKTNDNVREMNDTSSADGLTTILSNNQPSDMYEVNGPTGTTDNKSKEQVDETSVLFVMQSSSDNYLTSPTTKHTILENNTTPFYKSTLFDYLLSGQSKTDMRETAISTSQTSPGSVLPTTDSIDMITTGSTYSAEDHDKNSDNQYNNTTDSTSPLETLKYSISRISNHTTNDVGIETIKTKLTTGSPESTESDMVTKSVHGQPEGTKLEATSPQLWKVLTDVSTDTKTTSHYTNYSDTDLYGSQNDDSTFPTPLSNRPSTLNIEYGSTSIMSNNTPLASTDIQPSADSLQATSVTPNSTPKVTQTLTETDPSQEVVMSYSSGLSSISTFPDAVQNTLPKTAPISATMMSVKPNKLLSSLVSSDTRTTPSQMTKLRDTPSDGIPSTITGGSPPYDSPTAEPSVLTLQRVSQTSVSKISTLPMTTIHSTSNMNLLTSLKPTFSKTTQFLSIDSTQSNPLTIDTTKPITNTRSLETSQKRQTNAFEADATTPTTNYFPMETSLRSQTLSDDTTPTTNDQSMIISHKAETYHHTSPGASQETLNKHSPIVMARLSSTPQPIFWSMLSSITSKNVLPITESRDTPSVSSFKADVTISATTDRSSDISIGLIPRSTLPSVAQEAFSTTSPISSSIISDTTNTLLASNMPSTTPLRIYDSRETSPSQNGTSDTSIQNTSHQSSISTAKHYSGTLPSDLPQATTTTVSAKPRSSTLQTSSSSSSTSSLMTSISGKTPTEMADSRRTSSSLLPTVTNYATKSTKNDKLSETPYVGENSSLKASTELDLDTLSKTHLAMKSVTPNTFLSSLVSNNSTSASIRMSELKDTPSSHSTVTPDASIPATMIISSQNNRQSATRTLNYPIKESPTTASQIPEYVSSEGFDPTLAMTSLTPEHVTREDTNDASLTTKSVSPGLQVSTIPLSTIMETLKQSIRPTVTKDIRVSISSVSFGSSTLKETVTSTSNMRATLNSAPSKIATVTTAEDVQITSTTLTRDDEAILKASEAIDKNKLIDTITSTAFTGTTLNGLLVEGQTATDIVEHELSSTNSESVRHGIPTIPTDNMLLSSAPGSTATASIEPVTNQFENYKSTNFVPSVHDVLPSPTDNVSSTSASPNAAKEQVTKSFKHVEPASTTTSHNTAAISTYTVTSISSDVTMSMFPERDDTSLSTATSIPVTEIILNETPTTKAFIASTETERILSTRTTEPGAITTTSVSVSPEIKHISKTFLTTYSPSTAKLAETSVVTTETSADTSLSSSLGHTLLPSQATSNQPIQDVNNPATLASNQPNSMSTSELPASAGLLTTLKSTKTSKQRQLTWPKAMVVSTVKLVPVTSTIKDLETLWTKMNDSETTRKSFIKLSEGQSTPHSEHDRPDERKIESSSIAGVTTPFVTSLPTTSSSPTQPLQNPAVDTNIEPSERHELHDEHRQPVNYINSSTPTIEPYDTNDRQKEVPQGRVPNSSGNGDCDVDSCPSNSSCLAWGSYRRCLCDTYFQINQTGSCVHQCDLEYCQNSGECRRDDLSNKPSCVCKEGSTGTQCAQMRAQTDKVDLGVAVGVPIGLLGVLLLLFCCCLVICYSSRRRKKHRIVQGNNMVAMYSYPSVTNLKYVSHRFAEYPRENTRKQSVGLLRVKAKYASTSDLTRIPAPSKVRLLQGASTLSLVDKSSIIQQKRERMFSPMVEWGLFRSRQSLDRDMFRAPRGVGSRRSMVNYV